MLKAIDSSFESNTTQPRETMRNLENNSKLISLVSLRNFRQEIWFEEEQDIDSLSLEEPEERNHTYQQIEDEWKPSLKHAGKISKQISM